MRSVVVLVVVAVVGSTAWAQSFMGSPKDCELALKKDLIHVVKSANQEYAYLNIIDQRTFEEMKHSADASASIPLTAGLVEASASYEDFLRRRAELFQRVEYQSSIAQSETALQLVTSPAGYDAFKLCMEVLARNTYGFFAFKTGETKDAVIFEYTYHPQPEANKPIRLTGTVVNGSVPGVPAGQVFPAGTTLVANGSATIQVLRTKPGEMSIVVNGGGMTAPPIRSRWANAEPVERVGSAYAVVTRLKPITTRESGPVAQSGWTSDNNNRRCRHAPCSSDNKWQADLVELRITAPPSAILENPHMSCQSSADPGVCAHVDVDRLEVQDGGHSAFLSLRASSRPARFTLSADAVTTTTKRTEEPLPAREIRAGQTFTITIPTDITSAVIMLSYNGHDEAVSPGASSSDASFAFLSKVSTDGSVRYVYILKKN